MNYNQPSSYYANCVMDSKLKYLNLKVYCVITDRLRRVVMRGNPNSCPWLLLPGWYGWAHAWSTGQAVGFSRELICVPLALSVSSNYTFFISTLVTKAENLISGQNVSTLCSSTSFPESLLRESSRRGPLEVSLFKIHLLSDRRKGRKCSTSCNSLKI